MKRKIRCAVCGFKFWPEVYQAEETTGAFNRLSGGTKIYDACDCPECGRQKLLGERYKRIAQQDEQLQQDEIVLDIDEGEEEDDE